MPPELNHTLSDRYEVLSQVKGSLGGRDTALGTKGLCRYCGSRDPQHFRTVAHTFPEALGNVWITSLDECDRCNRTFMRYDDAIAAAVSPFLTLGGVRGKDSKVRQTGRSNGHAVLQRRQASDLPSIMFLARNASPTGISIDPTAQTLELTLPVAAVSFRPRHAYKALCKMGFALLPDDELDRFKLLRGWLLDVNDNVEFCNLEVAMSYASVGQELPMVCGTLLRRRDPTDICPYMLFVLTVGSVCLQVDLMPDEEDNHLPVLPPGHVNIEWRNIVGDESDSQTIEIAYSRPAHFNWAPSGPIPQPVEYFLLEFSMATRQGKLTPCWRPT
jgi:HNH endonuclease